METPKQKKEKTGARKVIDGQMHVCRMGPTADSRFTKCYFCPRIDRVK